MLILNFNFVVYDKEHYYNFFDTNGIFERYGKDDVTGAFEQLFKFYTRNEEIDDSYFNEREIKHIEDVGNVLFYLRWFSLLTVPLLFLFIIFFRLDIKFINKMFLWCLFILLIFGLIVYFGFDSIFLNMHRLLFDDGTWVFNENYWLIKLFPEEFFIKTGILIFVNSFLMILFAFIILKIVDLSKESKIFK